jgi:hypothetical protein
MLIPINVRYTESFFIFMVLASIIYTLNIDFKTLFTPVNRQVNGQVIKQYKFNGFKKAGFFYVVAFVLVFVHANGSMPILFSRQYRDLIGEVEEAEFTQNFSAVDLSQLPIVDHDLAAQLGDKKLGSEAGLGSVYHVGKFTDISINGKLVSVAPLEYNDFFKWLTKRSVGTPGYIIVDKVTREVELVTKYDDAPIRMKYMPTGYFGHQLKRHTYFNGNMDNQLYEFSFELDDNMKPYWVAVKTKKTIGINGGDDVLSVITVDPQSGEVLEYDVDEAPEWIDMIYPRQLVLKQLNDWGIYVNGYFNSIFAQQDVIRTTYGSRRVFNEGNVYHYTGLTSSGADESTVGFAFINTRTKKTNFYSITGSTENAAMESAEGAVQNLRYHATFPIPLNVNDIPTFFITLKDDKGLIKQYSFVNIADFSIVGNGETIEKAYQDYFKKLGAKTSLPLNGDTRNISGNVLRVGSSVIDGETEYYFVLDGVDGIYVASATLSSELSITEVGDSIEFTSSGLRIIEFDNKNIK